MPSLHKLQRAFSAATIFSDAAALASLGIVAAGLKADARIDIYRANVLGNYRRALAATYPVIKRLVGTAFFNAASDNFVRGYPSTRGDINQYGADFSEFLSAYPPARDLEYLPDVARLEWAVDQAGIARDAAAFDLAALAAVPAEMHGELRFSLHPSTQLIVSMYPILRIWRANQPGSNGDERIDLGEGGDTLLVVRCPPDPGGVAIERISRAEHLLLASLAAGSTLDEAATRCAEMSSEFALPAALRRHVTGHTIVAFCASAIPTPGHAP